MNILAPQPGKLDQITAKIYLDNKVMDLLEKSLSTLLETINKNGEFEKYLELLAHRREIELRLLRRRARETRRLEQGDEYVSSDTEETHSEPDSCEDELEQ